MSGRARVLALLTATIAILPMISSCNEEGRPSGEEEAQPDLGPLISPPPDEDGEGEEGEEDKEGEEEPTSQNEVAVGPAFAEPRIFVFGPVSVGESSELSITVRNIQQTPVFVTSVDVVGSHQQDFAVAQTGCLPDMELGAQDTCEIALVFAPTEIGEREAVLQISLSGGAGRQVRLAGTGV